MVETKIKINFNEGLIEIEGSEEFVEKHWDEVLELIHSAPTQNLGNNPAQKEGSKTKTPKSGKKDTTKISTTPISIDIIKKDDKPSLNEFYALKSPKNDSERLTLFAYYMKKFLHIDDMQAGHAMFCYSTVKEKKPTNFTSAMTNAITRTGWVKIGSEPYTLTTTIGGDNHIEFEMNDNIKNASKE